MDCFCLQKQNWNNRVTRIYCSLMTRLRLEPET
jgi:hypothetical protein